VLRAAPPRQARQRVYVPIGTDGAWLRAEGYATVAALDAILDPTTEAARLRCSHVLIGDALIALQPE
jgi:ATP phosphoribosyltransferase regulatory subunit